MIKSQVIIRKGHSDLSEEEMELFAKKVGRENVRFVAAPQSVEFIERLPIFRIFSEGAERAFCGEDALEQMAAL